MLRGGRAGPARRRGPPFALDGLVEAIDDGRCRLSLGAWSWVGPAATIGRFDTGIHVVGPPQLAEAFATLSTRYAAAATAGGTAPH
ncbi:hypothetical protein [Blastococcus haudaquaticus]|uniref:hypothetical protein n=1 Tax=Blastococcus haudaquaticus TaxID=1938745 RepID=UPI000BE26F24|nr:hypothetical protein [Blastococcus haudaquaticus]